MYNFIFSKRFKNDFKKNSSLNKHVLLDKLITLFDMPEYHFCRATMHQFYIKFPQLSFDKELASEILLRYFEKGFFSIPDYNLSFYTEEDTSDDDNDNLAEATKEDLAIIEKKSSLNWLGFFQKIQDIYWSDSPNNELLERFNFFESREPKNLREKFLSSENTVRANGKLITSKYLFFNIKQVLKYYEKLFLLYFHEYPLNIKASTRTTKRYAKKLENGIHLAVMVDYGFLESELKMGYLEFPSLKVEIFSDALILPIKETTYLSGEMDCAIARIDLFYFMGHFIGNRVGNVSESSEVLQKKLHFYFNVQLYYMKIYLETIERILIQCNIS